MIKAEKTNPHPPKIRIVGKSVMQNELLASYLSNKTGYECTHMPNLNLPMTYTDNAGRLFFFLLDSKSTDLPKIWNNLNDRLIPKRLQMIFSIFNMDPNDSIGIEAVNQGIRGIFFNNDPVDVIPKGIKAILEGEMWYPRKILSKCIEELRKQNRVSGNSDVNLTKRERDILLRIFAGKSNQEIADNLCVSYHTVKTHVYNIYRKINTPNRFQATLWAAKHL